MPLDFPNSPTTGQTWNATNGALYTWDGTKWTLSPGTQIAGWGTPTGGTRTANFPGASATLAQTSAVVAQLITDLKTYGVLGV